MINSVPVLIEWITRSSPAKRRLYFDNPRRRNLRKPPTYLKPGDVVTVRETTIGELTNPSQHDVQAAPTGRKVITGAANGIGLATAALRR
jgi:hypothetical protein